MKKTLKILAILIGGLLTLLIVVAVTLTLLFDPNDYKGDIIKLVKDKTGRELTIEGKLEWSFFPWVGIETGRLELSNAPGFGKEPFARIDGAGAKVKLLPLLRKQVVVDTIFLDGLKLNLAKNAAGKTNWDDLVAPSKTEPAAEKTVPDKEPGVGGISVNKIDIRKADVIWKDQASNTQYAVRNLNLQTGKIIVGEPVEVQLAFDLESGQPPVRKHLDLKSRMKLDIKAQSLEIMSLALGFDESRLTGTLTIRNFDKPAYRFDLALDQIDLDRYMPTPPPAAPGAKTANTAPPPPVEIPLSMLRSLDVQGKLRIQKLKAMNLHSNDVAIQVAASNGLITLGPNQAKLYGGSYQGTTSIDTRGKVLALSLKESLNGVQLQDLMKDGRILVDSPLGFTGAAKLGVNLTAQGLEAKQITQTLSGNVEFDIADGAVIGVDLKKTEEIISTAIKQKTTQNLSEIIPKPEDKTSFTYLRGNAQIDKGLVLNENLKLESPNLVRVNGKGTVDLPKETINYIITVGTFPIKIGGTFSKPTYSPDWNTILKAKGEQKIEEKKTEVKEKFEKKLDQKLEKYKLFKK